MKKKSLIFKTLVASVAMFTTILSPAAAEKKYSEVLVVDDDNDETNGLAYEPVTVIKKNLIIENGANIPNVAFGFTADVPDADHCSSDNERLVCDATADTLAVIKGVNPDAIVWKNENQSAGSVMIGAIEYAAQAKDSAAPDEDGDYVTITDNRAGSKESDTQYTATKSVSLDFSKVGFDEPGIYRYIITESYIKTDDSVNGIICDPNVTGDDNCKRTLDVYVIDAGVDANENPVLAVSGFVLYQGVVTDGPSNDTTVTANEVDDTVKLEDGTTSKSTNGKEVKDAAKSVGFENEYNTHDLTFSKKVEGNQGSRDKYFAFTLEIGNVGPGTVLDVSYADDQDDSTTDGDADVTISKNPNAATTVITDDVEQPTVLTADSKGELSQSFYLQHGQKIVVRGIPDKAIYSLSENEEDYDPEILLTGDDKDEKETFDDDTDDEDLLDDTKVNEVLDPSLTDDVTLDFTNSRAGVIPTGVKLPLVSVIVLGAVLMTGVLVLVFKKREEE
ncbi:MAG: hypothetical protein IJM14_09235 [Lachnospiraceae bacterium]|nr:hypothetical protein [Lachnospiraceae bacterium]